MVQYCHVDVFSSKPLSGNGLTVVFPNTPPPDGALLEIAREFRQFETIFIYPPNHPGVFPARIFTVDEELLFAGHPIIGAGAVVHRQFFPTREEVTVSFELGNRLVPVQSRREEQHYRVTMNQGEASFQEAVDKSCSGRIAAALGIREGDIDDSLPIEVASTGLPYLLVPLRDNVAKCRIMHENFESFLSGFGAKFVYVFDTATLECRTWDNVAHTEDIATGSAAGPLCAYLVRNGIKKRGEEILIHQGRFLNRPSIIKGLLTQGDGNGDVLITGDVSWFASGMIEM